MHDSFKGVFWKACGAAVWLFIAISVVGIWVVWASKASTISRLLVGADDLAGVGQWGDSFGALNALFSGLAFIAVLATLRSQARALKNQQEDQHRQRFDTTFF